MGTSTADAQPLAAGDDVLAGRASEDFEAFAELYRRHHCPVFRFIRSHVRNEAIAEDLTAQVFFKALRSARTYRGEGSYQAWLFRIARNSVATWRRRDGAAVVLDSIPDEEDPAPSPPSQVIDREARHLVWGTVAELPVAQREVVTLRYLMDLSIEEIARATRRTRGAVRILLHRARARLRKSLEMEDE
ncbi:MAG: RNA polymerase sigma factor [Actinomycetota bacterium]